MKTSVLVIAHNEECYIEQCLTSVLQQSLQPDEIVVVAHNCTDRTVDLVKEFPSVRLVEYSGPAGTIYARIKAFEEASNEYIACIDGDTVAEKNWLRDITAPLVEPEISGVGGYVALGDAFLERLAAWHFFYLSKHYRRTYSFYFWGASFACRKPDYEYIGGLEPLLRLKEELQLNYTPDDLYLSLSLRKIGRVIFVPEARSYSHTSEQEPLTILSPRARKSEEDRVKLFKHFGLL